MIELVTSQTKDLFIEVLKQANQRVLDKGEKMWNPSELTFTQLEKDYDGGYYYLGMFDGKLAYTAILMFKDVPFWGETSDQCNAVYVHKLAITNAFSGSGASMIMLDEIKQECIRLNKSCMRLDVRANKPKLIAFYERYGFKRVKTDEFYYGQGHLYEYVL